MNKKIIEKLLAVAEKQQKIIIKMAQAMNNAEPLGGATSSWDDVAIAVNPVVQQAVQAVGAKGQYKTHTAQFGKDSGTLQVKLEFPMSFLGTPECNAVLAKAKTLLANTPIEGHLPKNVQIMGMTV